MGDGWWWWSGAFVLNCQMWNTRPLSHFHISRAWSDEGVLCWSTLSRSVLLARWLVSIVEDLADGWCQSNHTKKHNAGCVRHGDGFSMCVICPVRFSGAMSGSRFPSRRCITLRSIFCCVSVEILVHCNSFLHTCNTGQLIRFWHRMIALSWFHGWWCTAVLTWWTDCLVDSSNERDLGLLNSVKYDSSLITSQRDICLKYAFSARWLVILFVELRFSISANYLLLQLRFSISAIYVLSADSISLFENSICFNILWEGWWMVRCRLSLLRQTGQSPEASPSTNQWSAALAFELSCSKADFCWYTCHFRLLLEAGPMRLWCRLSVFYRRKQRPEASGNWSNQ